MVLSVRTVSSESRWRSSSTPGGLQRDKAGEQLGEGGAAISTSVDLELGSEEGGIRIDERGAVAFEQVRRGEGAVEVGELRFVVNELQVARCAGHEEEDHPLRLGRKVRL